MNPEIEKLEQQRSEITRKIEKLLEEERNFYVQESKKLVGICGIDIDQVDEYGNKYAFLIYKPLDVEYGVNELYFNKHQIPVIFINLDKEGEMPYQDFLYCSALDCDDPVAYIFENYEEITQEEFKELYYNRMKSILESAIKESKNEE